MLSSGKKSEGLVAQEVHISKSRACCHYLWIAAKQYKCLYLCSSMFFQCTGE